MPCISGHGDIARAWRGRLEANRTQDLRSCLDELPELRQAITPPPLDFTLLEGSHLTLTDTELAMIVHARLNTESGVEVGTLSIDIDTAGGASIEDIHLDRRAQGFGLGRGLVKEILFLCAGLGFEFVDIRAFDVGRYAWATCGFDFVDDDRELVIDAAADFADRLKRPFDPDAIEHVWDIAQCPGPPVPLELVTSARGDAPTEGKPMTFGQALLLGPTGNEWTGRFDMRDGSPSRTQLGL